MSKLIATFLALLMTGCGWILHPIDTNSHGFDHRAKGPVITKVVMGQADQVCAGKKGTAPIIVYVLPKHPGVVKLVLNNTYVFKVRSLEGSAEFDFKKVEQGPWTADVYLDDEYQMTVYWSVWDCGPEPQKDPLFIYNYEKNHISGQYTEK